MTKLAQLLKGRAQIRKEDMDKDAEVLPVCRPRIGVEVDKGLLPRRDAISRSRQQTVLSCNEVRIAARRISFCLFVRRLRLSASHRFMRLAKDFVGKHHENRYSGWTVEWRPIAEKHDGVVDHLWVDLRFSVAFVFPVRL